jgi:DUF438 domain-containing protein
MSEFTDNHIKRTDQLTGYTTGLIEGQKGLDLLERYKIIETIFLPQDILALFDNLFARNLPIEKIKTASNKLFNILFKSLSERKQIKYPHNSILDLLVKDNAGVRIQLSATRRTIRKINQEYSPEILSALSEEFTVVERFTSHYTVMENIVFPEIERNWEKHQCLKLMWSFHDDIRRNISKTMEILRTEPFNIRLFNETISKVYFNISTIIFREEHVLFPILHETFSDEAFEIMKSQLEDFRLAFTDVHSSKKKDSQKKTAGILDQGKLVILNTGELDIEQIELIFNHLPVDITFVDEHNRVKYFSTPQHRIFPRTTGIINRLVQNCHPHESVHVVNKIVEAFKSGEKDEASFWIKMGPKFVLIRYFAVRDKEGKYRGVLEVSQEISGIQELSGERKLLDW